MENAAATGEIDSELIEPRVGESGTRSAGWLSFVFGRHREGVPSMDRRVLGLAWPAIGENLLQTSLLMVDTAMIAGFDPMNPAPLAASAVAGTILWRAQMTLGCIDRGTTALVARAMGAGDRDRVGRVVAQAMFLALLIGSATAAAGFFASRWLLSAMGAKPDVVAVGTPFLQVIFLASVARMVFAVCGAALRAAGDTRSPMHITLVMNGINLIMNYALIYGHFGAPRLGLTGSAIATAAALVFAAVSATLVMLTGATKFDLKWRHLRFSPSTMGSILRISAPSFLEEIIVSVGFLGFTACLTSLGTSVLAAHTVATRVEALSYMAGWGFAVAASTLVGQSLGAGNVPTAHLAFRRSTVWCVALMSAVAVGLVIFGNRVVGWFTPGDDYVRQLARALLMIAVIEQPFMAIFMTLAGGIRGAGDTFSPMLVSLWGNVVTRLAICALSLHFGWGVEGIYVGTIVDWAMRCTLMYAAYRGGRWATVKV